MDKNQTEMLQRLQEAIQDAIAQSYAVGAAMDELERAGICPSLTIDVALPEQQELPAFVGRKGRLRLSAGDELFLRSVGITAVLEGSSRVCAPRQK